MQNIDWCVGCVVNVTKFGPLHKVIPCLYKLVHCRTAFIANTRFSAAADLLFNSDWKLTAKR